MKAWLDPAIVPAEALSSCEPLAADRMASEIRHAAACFSVYLAPTGLVLGLAYLLRYATDVTIRPRSLLIAHKRNRGDIMVPMTGGRYRSRTWLRGHMPASLARLVPKGARRPRP
jgi:hypothetical protein